MEENSHLNEINRKNGIEIENMKESLIKLKDKAEWELKKREDTENRLQDKINSLQREFTAL